VNPDWRVVGAALQGNPPARAGRGCEDAFQANLTRQRRRVPDDAPLVLAACDGAGSRSRSAEGAALGVELAVSIFEERFLARPPQGLHAWNVFLRESLCLVMERFQRVAAVLARAGGTSAEPSDFATTLLVAVASPPWMGLVSIGDGFAVTRAGRAELDQYHLVVAPDPGGRYAGETTFLTSGAVDPARSTWALWDPDLTGLALSTDGLTDVALEFEGSRPLRAHRDFFRPWFQRADDRDEPGEKLTRFLASKDVCEQTADDKTLVLAVLSTS
jgi:hypothetical protein